MTATDHYERLPPGLIKFKRDERQRSEIDVTDLLPSVKERGILSPIWIGRDRTLLAGERRLTCALTLGLPDIPVRYFEDLTQLEREVLELEENIKRQDLHWHDLSRAVASIHKKLESANPDWSKAKTALYLGMNKDYIPPLVRLAEELSDPRIAAAPTWRAAYNMIARKDDRAFADALSDLMVPVQGEREEGVLPPTSYAVPLTEGEPQSPRGALPPAPPPDPPPLQSILTLDFREFAQTYNGPRFNLLHCDFPYGINMQNSDQGRTEQWGGYDDTPQVYWELLDTLSECVDSLLAPSSHLLFWFSMKFYRETLDYFERNIPSILIQPIPLIWHKTDNRGILADPRRRPRNIYEVAFLGSRGDRMLVKPVSNVYGCPTAKSTHQSEKPRPMLTHFLSMFVDENTRLLDPTCGSGNALQAAEGLGAKPENLLGLEINPDFANEARAELKKFRNLRSITDAA